MAGGFSLKEENLPQFKEFLTASIIQQTKNSKEQYLKLNEIHYDLELNVDPKKPYLYRVLDQLEPTGIQYPSPLFVFINLKLDFVKTIGKEHNHLRIQVSNSLGRITAILWNYAYHKELEDYLLDDRNINSTINILGTLNINEWKNKTELQIIIKDIHKA